MDVLHGIARRMELFESFSEGEKLLRGRKITVSGERPKPAAGPTVFVAEHSELKKRRIEHRVVILLWDNERNLALIYAQAEELEDFLANFLDFSRVSLRDGNAGGGSWLRLEYCSVGPFKVPAGRREGRILRGR